MCFYFLYCDSELFIRSYQEIEFVDSTRVSCAVNFISLHEMTGLYVLYRNSCIEVQTMQVISAQVFEACYIVDEPIVPIPVTCRSCDDGPCKIDLVKVTQFDSLLS